MNWLRRLVGKVAVRKPNMDREYALRKLQTKKTLAEGKSIKIPKRKLIAPAKSSDRSIFFSPIETNTDKILSKARIISEAGSSLTRKITESHEPSGDNFSPVGK